MSKTIWRLETPSGYLIQRFKGTKREAIRYAENHYITYGIVRDSKLGG